MNKNYPKALVNGREEAEHAESALGWKDQPIEEFSLLLDLGSWGKPRSAPAGRDELRRCLRFPGLGHQEDSAGTRHPLAQGERAFKGEPPGLIVNPTPERSKDKTEA